MTSNPVTASMARRTFHMTTASALLLTAMVCPRPAIAGVSVDCEGSARAYAAQGIPCYCKGGRIVCDSPSGGSSSGKSTKKGLSPKNQMKMQMLQGAMDDFANSFIRWINAPPRPAQQGPTPEQAAAEREQQERAKAEWLAKVQQQMNKVESEYEQMERLKAANKRGNILAGLKMGNAGSGGQPSALQQMRCTAFWNKKAAEAKDDETAMKYSRFAEKPDKNSMAACAKELPEPPEPPMPSPVTDFRADLLVTVTEEINLRLPMIEEAKAKQREADERVAKLKKKTEELKGRHADAASPQEKKEAYDLLEQIMKEEAIANGLKNEADSGLAMLKLEVDALNEVRNMAASAKNNSSKEKSP